MVSAQVSNYGKLGEKRIVQQQAETIGSSLQQLTDEEFGRQALLKQKTPCFIPLVRYESVLRMIEALRHRNSLCIRTVGGYVYDVGRICEELDTTPDTIILETKGMDEDRLQSFFMKLDQAWMQRLNCPGTRARRWAVLRKFLRSNGVKNARLVDCSIEQFHVVDDRLPTKLECARLLDSCQNSRDKLLVSLLIESLQRIGTLAQLVWGDVLEEIPKDIDSFLIWIDMKRTKRNIAHWAPIGKLSSHYIRERFHELRSLGIEIRPEMPLLAIRRHLGKPLATRALIQHMGRLLSRANIRGKRLELGGTSRFEVHVHAFRKFGVVEMQRASINEEIIRFLMGQKTSTYSHWIDRPEELLTIYMQGMPHLDEKDATEQILNFARSRGFDLDPKAFMGFLNECGKIGSNKTNCSLSCQNTAPTT